MIHVKIIKNNLFWFQKFTERGQYGTKVRTVSTEGCITYERFYAFAKFGNGPHG